MRPWCLVLALNLCASTAMAQPSVAALDSTARIHRITAEDLKQLPIDSVSDGRIPRPGIADSPGQLHFRCGPRQLPAAVHDPDSGVEMLGHAPPALQVDRWARGGVLTLADLRGRVVLVRFWTTECRFCAETLPALEQLRRAHGDSLVVIGIYHPEPVRHVSDRVIVRAAEKLGFHGPIAVDEHARTLNSWWLDGHPDRDWTSPSFLIDRAGNVRWVHGGGEYHPNADPRHARCDVQYRELQRVLAQVLAEPDSLTTRRE